MRRCWSFPIRSSLGLTLWDIPHSGYVPPEALVASLPSITKIDLTPIEPADVRLYQHALFSPLWPHFNYEAFRRVPEVLVVFHSTQLSYLTTPQFIAHVVFSDNSVRFYALQAKGSDEYISLELVIPCIPSDWQPSSVAQVCSSFLPRLSTLESLEIRDDQSSQSHWQDDMEISQWLEPLHFNTRLPWW